MDATRITVRAGGEDLAELEANLDRENMAQTGITDGRDLTIIVRVATGALVGGLHGFTWGGYGEIKLLWVAPERRGTGIGSTLLAAAEREAKARGCGRIILSTHSFQAPRFYARHGFVQVAEIADCPRDFAHIVLMKTLSPCAEPKPDERE